MNDPFSKQLFLASAGTGKTYRLSAHFVGLLLHGVPPERILATTFTRKAAGEILGRVLQRLVQVVQEPRAALELGQLLGCTIDRDAARARLPRLARTIHRFQVRTLDSHTIAIARLFEAELGLPPGWSIVDEVTDLDLRDEAMNQALEGASEEEWMGLLRGMDPTGERRGVFEQMSHAVRELRNLYLESEAEAWDRLVVPPGLDAEEWERLLASLDRFVDLPQTKAGKPNANWLKAFDSLRALARAGAWENMLEAGLAKAYLTPERSYHRLDFPEALKPLMEGVIAQSRHRLVEFWRERNLALFALLERFEASYAGLKQSLGQLRFEDLPRFLDPLGEHRLFDSAEGLGLDEVWLRMDGRIDHLLLDEFQDTSSVQWRSLKPLASEICSTHGGEHEESRTFFCVGDPKQSIYGWRQAEPRLLEGLRTEFPGLEVQALTDNYRSSPLIMELCNRLFQNLLSSAAWHEEGRQAERSAAHAFQAQFPAHVAARPAMAGCVQLWQVQTPAEGAGEVAPSTLEWAAERVARLRQEAPRTSIGVLFRSRKHIAPFLHLLSSRHGLRATGEGGNPLVDSEAVSVLASLLHLVDHPGDAAAAFHVGTSPLGAALGFVADDWNWGDRKALDRRTASRALARRVRGELLELGYGDWLARLWSSLQSVYSDWDRVRFEQWIENCERLAQAAPLRPGQVARFLRETRVPSPWSASIQAMTIHASKGLEFDAVILPDLDARWFQSESLHVGMERPDPAGWFDRISVLPSKELRRLEPNLERLAALERQTQTREALNLLYVALTRAEHRLECIVGPSKQGLTYANLLLDHWRPEASWSPSTSMPGVDLRFEAQTTTQPWWIRGDESPSAPPDGPQVASEIVTDALEPIRFRGQGARILQRTPSQEHSQSSERTGLQCLGDKVGAERGSLVHGWLEAIEWIVGDPNAAIQAVAARCSGAGAQSEAVRNTLVQAFRSPDFAGLFVPPSKGAEVYRERRFLCFEEGSKVLWAGSIDRLVVEREGGRAVRAHVIDFKTGWVESDEAAILEAHADQLRLYRKAAALQFGLPETHIELTLALVDRASCLRVDGTSPNKRPSQL